MLDRWAGLLSHPLQFFFLNFFFENFFLKFFFLKKNFFGYDFFLQFEKKILEKVEIVFEKKFFFGYPWFDHLGGGRRPGGRTLSSDKWWTEKDRDRVRLN